MISASSSAGDSGVEWSSDCSRSKEIESFAKGGTTGISPISVDGVLDIDDVGEEKGDNLNKKKLPICSFEDYDSTNIQMTHKKDCNRTIQYHHLQNISTRTSSTAIFA